MGFSGSYGHGQCTVSEKRNELSRSLEALVFLFDQERPEQGEGEGWKHCFPRCFYP